MGQIHSVDSETDQRMREAAELGSNVRTLFIHASSLMTAAQFARAKNHINAVVTFLQSIIARPSRST